MTNIATQSSCPCGSGKHYGACCQPVHQSQNAATPEQLMRSRYSAFLLHLYDYLLVTHHQDFRGELSAAALAEAQPEAWLSLQVRSARQQATTGEVHFCAWYRENGQVSAINEVSQFCLENGHWFYTTGKQLPVKLPGRNDKCICGSGKKFKQCCAK